MVVKKRVIVVQLNNYALIVGMDFANMKSEDIGRPIKESKIYQTEAYLIREALVQEMIDAERWQTIVKAWEALLKVKRMYEDMLEPDDRILPKTELTML